MPSPAQPLVTIVTPSFNQAQFLPDTLASVRRQDYPRLEHIVMDGGSTDGTLAILQNTPGLRWVSEPDRGQVHALNKGFALATGEILAWLNSDDTLNPDTVSLAVAALQRTGADLVYGDVEIVDEQGRLLKLSRGIPFDYRVLLYGINYIGQQTTFFRRELLDRAGPLREEFNNAFDYELWLRFARHGRLAYAPELRAQIRLHPQAKSVAQAAVTLRDRDRIRAEYWASGGHAAFWSRPPGRQLLNYWYRLRRQLRCRR
jgi:glycosyltransferase involved in cell wall biosynthesis